MAKKATGLAAFTRLKAGADNVGVEPAEMSRPSVEVPAPRRKRGGGETVALTVKVRRSDWQRDRPGGERASTIFRDRTFP
jgi:hypothetical protein